jgi:hypothetical protein
MSIIKGAKAIKREDIPGDVPDWINYILDPLNSFMDTTITALRNGINYQDNIKSSLKKFVFNDGEELIISHKFSGRVGIHVLYCEDFFTLKTRQVDNDNIGVTFLFRNSGSQEVLFSIIADASVDTAFASVSDTPLYNIGKSYPIGGLRISGCDDICENEAYPDGSAISRTTYAALFAKYGVTWGAGDGTTTFNILDLRSATLRCVGTPTIFTSNDAVALADTIDDQMQGHFHGPPGDANSYYAKGGSGAIDNIKGGLAGIRYNNNTSGPITDGVNGVPRTGTETTGKARGIHIFMRLY